MVLQARLELKQTQRLVMTAMLQQAIKLLPLSRLELVQRITQELAENPALDDVSALEEEQEVPEEGDTVEGDERIEELLGIDWENYILDRFDSGFSEEDVSEGPSYENTLRKEISLYDHLTAQLPFVTEDPKELGVGTFLIGNIDEDGYLRGDLESVCVQLDVDMETVKRVLGLIQSLDPTGVGARDLPECLLIQLRERGPEAGRAIEILQNYLPELEARDLQRIERKMKVPLAEVLAAISLIRQLDPYPGRQFDRPREQVIVPDISVVKGSEGYQVILNDDGVPRLRVSPYYQQVLRRNSFGPTRSYLEERLRSAVWLIKSIEQRRRTLLKVAQSIVNFQNGFLDRGTAYLRPLVLRDVAEDIGMHESTVSRVTTNKYIETPQGIFELKFFFHSGIGSLEGDVLSSVQVKAMLQAMIVQEKGDSPFTDQEIVERLHDEGVVIARRTIAKYRKELRIPSSGSRKKRALY